MFLDRLDLRYTFQAIDFASVPLPASWFAFGSTATLCSAEGLHRRCCKPLQLLPKISSRTPAEADNVYLSGESYVEANWSAGQADLQGVRCTDL